MTSLKKQERSPAMDIIRCVALFCVIAVHFSLNNGFYDEVVKGARMYVMVVMRSSFMVCVPLFIVLSGYLLNKRTPTAGYYIRIVKTLLLYVFASLACEVYRWTVLGEEISVVSTIKDILSFSAAPYSWYVEMYIGLFMLIPFLNILYNNIPAPKAKKGFLVILLILTSLPLVINIHRVVDFKWWLMPSSSDSYNALIPDWWTGMYPLTYYFIGCYLKEYPIKMKPIKNFLLIVVTFLLIGTFNYYRSYNVEFIWGKWQNWGSLLIVIQTVLVFSFFTQFTYEKWGTKSRKIIAKLSDFGLCAYLVSWIFDQVFYKILNEHQPTMKLRLEYFIIIVPVVYLCSLALSAILTTASNFISDKIIGRLSRMSTKRADR